MTEYVDREKLLATINKNPAEAHNERCAQLLEAILQAPTEDVVPRAEVEEIVKFKDMAYAELKSYYIQAKQEVAREMLGEIDFVFKTMKMEIETHIGEAIIENDLLTESAIQYGKDVICLAEKVLFKALNKYIGEQK